MARIKLGFSTGKGFLTKVDSAAQADNATSAASATNVTTKINNKNITSIFESNGTTAKKATEATETAYSNTTWSDLTTSTAFTAGNTYEVMLCYVDDNDLYWFVNKTFTVGFFGAGVSHTMRQVIHTATVGGKSLVYRLQTDGSSIVMKVYYDGTASTDDTFRQVHKYREIK